LKKKGLKHPYKWLIDGKLGEGQLNYIDAFWTDFVSEAGRTLKSVMDRIDHKIDNLAMVSERPRKPKVREMAAGGTKASAAMRASVSYQREQRIFGTMMAKINMAGIYLEKFKVYALQVFDNRLNDDFREYSWIHESLKRVPGIIMVEADEDANQKKRWKTGRYVYLLSSEESVALQRERLLNRIRDLQNEEYIRHATPTILGLEGPGGAGKTTLTRHLLAQYPDRFTKIVETTDRAPNDGEILQQDWNLIFVSKEEFPGLAKKMFFAYESAGAHYGFQSSSLLKALRSGKILVMDIHNRDNMTKMEQFWPNAKIIRVAVLPLNQGDIAHWDGAAKDRTRELLSQRMQGRVSATGVKARLQMVDNLVPLLNVDHMIFNGEGVSMSELTGQMDSIIATDPRLNAAMTGIRDKIEQIIHEAVRNHLGPVRPDVVGRSSGQIFEFHGVEVNAIAEVFTDPYSLKLLESRINNEAFIKEAQRGEWLFALDGSEEIIARANGNTRNAAYQVAQLFHSPIIYPIYNASDPFLTRRAIEALNVQGHDINFDDAAGYYVAVLVHQITHGDKDKAVERIYQTWKVMMKRQDIEEAYRKFLTLGVRKQVEIQNLLVPETYAISTKLTHDSLLDYLSSHPQIKKVLFIAGYNHVHQLMEYSRAMRAGGTGAQQASAAMTAGGIIDESNRGDLGDLKPERRLLRHWNEFYDVNINQYTKGFTIEMRFLIDSNSIFKGAGLDVSQAFEIFLTDNKGIADKVVNAIQTGKIEENRVLTEAIKIMMANYGHPIEAETKLRAYRQVPFLIQGLVELAEARGAMNVTKKLEETKAEDVARLTISEFRNQASYKIWQKRVGVFIWVIELLIKLEKKYPDYRMSDVVKLDPNTEPLLKKAARSQTLNKFKIILGIYELSFKSKAMRADNAVLVQNGGIDFNSSNLAMLIKRDGKGVVLPLARQDLAQLSNIEGLEPEILSIRPASESPVFAQLVAH